MPKGGICKLTINTHVDSEHSSPPSMHIAEAGGLAYDGLKFVLKAVNDNPLTPPHFKAATSALLYVLGAIDVCAPPFADDLSYTINEPARCGEQEGI